MKTKIFLASILLAIVSSCSKDKETIVLGEDKGRLVKIHTIRSNYSINEEIEVDSVKSQDGMVEYYATQGSIINPYKPNERLATGYTFLGRGSIKITKIQKN